MGFDPALFEMHSLWAEVATVAAKTGVEDRLFKLEVGLSQTQLYVKASLVRHLEIMSKGLGYLTWPVLCVSTWLCMCDCRCAQQRKHHVMVRGVWGGGGDVSNAWGGRYIFLLYVWS